MAEALEPNTRRKKRSRKEEIKFEIFQCQLHLRREEEVEHSRDESRKIISFDFDCAETIVAVWQCAEILIDDKEKGKIYIFRRRRRRFHNIKIHIECM